MGNLQTCSSGAKVGANSTIEKDFYELEKQLMFTSYVSLSLSLVNFVLILFFLFVFVRS